MIRFDDDKKQVGLSVRDLADESDYRFSGPAPLSLKRRALLGRLAHEDLQEARENELSSYRRERGVRFELEVAGWRVVVTGRIDGIYTDSAGRTVIEEIKTIVAADDELERASQETFPAYTCQLQLYRYLVEEGSGALGFSGRAPEIALHLLLIALPSRKQRILELSYERAACTALVDRRLREIISVHEAELAREARRREVRERIRFPHEPRPNQDDMVEAIGSALETVGRILVSAPPGIGKTAAALVPALRRACALGGRVFVATSKTTQQAIFVKTLQMIREQGAPIRGVVLSAKGKVCLNDKIQCHADACQHARDYTTKVERSGALPRLLDQAVADRQSIVSEAREHVFCPFEAALDLTADVDVVIGDYNYVFDPGAALKRMFVERDPSDVVLVIDEAHNLYQRGMSYYSPELRRGPLQDLEQALVGQSSPIARRVRGLLQRLLQHLDAIERGQFETGRVVLEPEPEPDTENMLLFDDPGAQARKQAKARRASGRLARQVTESRRLEPPPPPRDPDSLPPERVVVIDREFFATLRDELGELAVAWFAEGGSTGEEQDPVLAFNRMLGRFVGVLELDGPEFTTIYAREQGMLKILCKDPSRQLARRLHACAGVVAVSATLEPLEFYRDVLGFGHDAILRSFPSPFDHRRRRVMVLDLPSTAWQHRERDLHIVEDAVRAVVGAHPGNYLVCCPSFNYLKKLGDRIEDLPGFEVLRQARFMPDASRQETLERLRRTGSESLAPVVLLTVQGGVFTEGVDYPGQDCVGVVIVGPGLPRVSFERELIRAYYETAYGRGFEYAFLYPGMAKVIQAAGRVIRTPTDMGVVVLVGARFATHRYASLFPRDWYARHPRDLVSLEPYEELKQFWQAPVVSG